MKTNHVRIIGGRWRSRKLQFPDSETLRPSPDRVRETLFNWLMPNIIDARCLDCFAGTGVLGFEALSRGAKSAVLLDNDPNVLQALENNKAELHAANVTIRQAKVPQDLKHFPEEYDIVFLDPPFGKGFISVCALALDRYHCVRDGGLVYLETELAEDLLELPESFTILKQAKAGRVFFYLCQFEKNHSDPTTT